MVVFVCGGGAGDDDSGDKYGKRLKRFRDQAVDKVRVMRKRKC